MKLSWGEYVAGISASITMTPGIDPDELQIEIGAPLAGNTLEKSANFTLDDEQGGAVTFFDMRAIDGTIRRSTSARVVQFRAHDRRWRWSMKDPISGDYNTKDASGEVIDNPFKKSARELGVILLDALGESGYSADGLPDDKYPQTEWDSVNPAQALQDLTEQFSVYICLGLDNIVNLYAAGDGDDEDANFDQQITARDTTQRVERRPKKITMVGGYNVDQFEIELSAVGLDNITGEYLSMDNVSWKPLGGFYPGYEEELAGDALDAANETGFKYYRLPALVEFEGEDIELEQILKYITDEIAETEIRDGQKVQKKPYCTGAHATELAFSRLAGFVNSVEALVPVGFKIDKKLGMVIFDEPVFSVNQTTEKMEGAEINITLALKKDRFEEEYEQAEGLEDTSAFVKRSDLRLLKIDGEIQNPEVLQESAEAVLAIAEGLQVDEPKTIAYTGIASSYAPDGLISQVTYGMDTGQGPYTIVSWQDEHDRTKPTAVQRRSAINNERASTAMLSGQKPAIPINERPNSEPIQIQSTAQTQKRERITQRRVINTSGQDIPPGSFAMKDGFDLDGYMQIIQPDEDNIEASKLVVTSPWFKIPSGKKACAMDALVPGISVNYTGTAPTTYEDFGSVQNSFSGKAGNTGFKAEGTGEGLAYATPFKAAGAIYRPGIHTTGNVTFNEDYLDGDTKSSIWYDFNETFNPVSKTQSTGDNIVLSCFDGTPGTVMQIAYRAYYPDSSTIVTANGDVFFYIDLKDTDGNVFSPTAPVPAALNITAKTQQFNLNNICFANVGIIFHYNFSTLNFDIESWRIRVTNSVTLDGYPTEEARIIATYIPSSTGANQFAFIPSQFTT